MNKILKRVLSGIITLSILITASAVSVVSAEDTLPSDELLFHLTFDEAGADNTSFEASLGGTVTKKGSVSLTQSLDEESGKALSIASNAAGNYLELPKGILNGKDSATFSFWIKPSSGWAFMTTPVSGAQEYLHEKYLGMLATASNFKAENYNNNGARPADINAGGTYSDWQYVSVVYNASSTKIYVNGSLAVSDSTAFDIKSLLTAEASTWIGHGNWGSGEGFSGMIDDFRIYGRALDEGEITKLSKKAIDRETDKMVKEKNMLEIDTQFYDEGGNKVFQAGSGKISVKTTVANYTPAYKKVKLIITPYSADGTAGGDIVPDGFISHREDGNNVIVSIKTSNSKKVSLIGAAYSRDNVLTNVVIKNEQVPAGESNITIEDVKTSDTDTAKAYIWDTAESLRPAESNAASLSVMNSSEFAVDVTPDSNTAYYKVTLSDITNPDKPINYDAGYLPVTDVSFPDATPADSANTTEGIHDPTIFKDPISKKYFAYSSHNLVFESEDLINWTKHDYTKTVTVPAKAKEFIDTNYSGTTANGTYWAPDLYYKEGDEYPYWFYLSTSCGLGGRNSVISLVKAKSPGLWDGETVDAGVVLASKENSNYHTNAIDANIYTDTDRKTYFIWGSFWKGIHGAELDTDTGLVKGVDYTSDTAILTSCQKFGKRLFSTPGGVQGPEGPYTVYNEDTGYRYMFTSYGWLGTNYNIRVARTNKTFSEIFADSNPHKQLLDQKNRPIGATYTDQVKEGGTLQELWGYKMSGSFQLGDGIEYLGSGHNSVFKDDDGQWYLVQHCRKIADAIAYLQVKKILWTEDGWPVISPMVYAGEEEQVIPKEMIYGTWDLSSVGQTIFASGVSDVGNRNSEKKVDMPVHSSQIILQADGTLGNGLGTWEYDGDHTVTINFTADGDNSKYEFYKNGDTMKLFVLTGYDKDKRESAIVMTGTDQNGVASFARKANQTAQDTRKINMIKTTPTVLEKSTVGNPILGFDADGNTMYAGDPAAMVDGDTVYIYAGHDTSTGDSYVMPEWVCYSSKNMTDWKYEGSVMKAKDVSWRNDDNSAWASQAIKYGDKYYLYFCTWDKTSGGKQSIGVAVSDSPTGPFRDIGAPLVKGTLTEPQTSNWNDIDPTVWVETVDGVEHRYLAWGNGIFYVCELNEDMTSVKDLNGDGQIKMNDDIKQQELNNLPESLGFTEAPWIYRQKDTNGNYTGKYYMFGAFGWREQMGYVTSDSMYGPWEWGGVLMPPTATSNTNHPSVIDFKGKTYFIYHNGSLPWGSGYRRSVCLAQMYWKDDDTIRPIDELSTGPNYSEAVRIALSTDVINDDEHHLAHEEFVNPGDDASYPLKKQLVMKTYEVHKGPNYIIYTDDSWQIRPAKYQGENENYVSIESYDKAGLYIASEGTNLVLTQQDTLDEGLAKRMTFKTVKGINGDASAVSFESITKKGYFITMTADGVQLTDGTDADACSFKID